MIRPIRSVHPLILELLGLLAPGLLLVACGSDSSKDPSETDDELPVLAFLWLPKELDNQVFETGRDGALAKADQLTKLGDYDVQIIYSGTDSAADIEGQAALIREADDLGVQGVALSCNASDGLRDAIDDVTVAGIPVMTFDSDSAESSRFTYLGVDNERGGTLAARILGQVMANGSLKKVALVSGVQGAANLEARMQGFQATLAEEFPDLEIIDPVYCDDNGDTAATLIEGLMADNADLGGLFWVGLWPLFVCEFSDCSERMPLWTEAAESGAVKTVVFDTLQFELDFVKRGLVSGLIGQKYWGWGFDAVQMLYDHVVHNKSYSNWTDSGIDVVCPNNVEAMDTMWQEADFTAPLAPCEIEGVPVQ